MSWNGINSAGGAEHAGTSRSAWMSPNDMPTTGLIQIEGDDFEDDVALAIFANGNATRRWECGLFTAGTKFQIRRVDDNAAQTPITDIASGYSGTNWKLRVELNEADIKFYRGDETTAFHTELLSNFDRYTTNKRFGFVSEVDGATVTSCRIFELEPLFDVAAEALVVVANGSVYSSQDAATLRLVAANVFNPNNSVSATVFQQRVYMVDGEKARIYNPVDDTVTEWTATSGDLPGKTGDGTTKATIVFTHRDRVWLAGTDTDPQNLFASAVGDPLNFDTAEPIEGRAFALNLSRAGEIGEPIVGAIAVTNNVLIIGCVSSVWQLVGDPAFGSADASPLMDTHGPTTIDSLLYVTEGVALLHTNDGVYMVPAGANPVNLSRGTVENGLNVSVGDSIEPHLSYDPVRQCVHVWMVNNDPNAAETHWCYDIRVGRYSPGQGGWFPDRLSRDHTPTASARYRKELLVGCRDGFIRRFNDAARGDDDQPINARVTIPIPGEPGYDTIVHNIDIQAGDQTQAQGTLTGRLLGSESFEQLLTRTGDVATLRTLRVDQRVRRSIMRVRDNAVGLELASSDLGLPWEFEYARAEIGFGSAIQRRGLSLAAATLPPAPPDDDDDDTGDSGPGAYG